MNHIEFSDLESQAQAPDKWDAWIDKAEKIAEHRLDGGEPGGDKYSLDSAHAAFKCGKTPKQYVEGFRRGIPIHERAGYACAGDYESAMASI